MMMMMMIYIYIYIYISSSHFATEINSITQKTSTAHVCVVCLTNESV